MSDDYTVEVHVDSQLLRILNMGFHDSLNNALKTTCMEAERIMKAEAPIDTGNLRRSLTPEYDDLVARIKTAGDKPAYYLIIFTIWY